MAFTKPGALILATILWPVAAAPDDTSPVIGDWRGESLCVAANTACRDETVVYHIAKHPEKSAYVSVSADKIVDGKAVNMGTLEFRYDDARHTLECEYAQGVWCLKVDGAKIEGTLT